jgi:hypothetical protein
MTGIMCSLTGGGVVYAGSATMTVGYQTFDQTSGDTRFVGYRAGYYPTTSMGAMSNTVFGGTVDITDLYYTNFDVYYSGVYSQTVRVLILNTDENIPNEGWTNLVANGTTFTRASASYSTGDWTWINVLTNPLGTSGTVPITWG